VKNYLLKSLPDFELFVILSTTIDKMDTIKEILSQLNIPAPAQAVYIDLLQNGQATARQIASRVGVPRSSLYDHVRPLLTARLVVEKDTGGKAVFAVHDVNDLERLLSEKIDEVSLMRQRFNKEKVELFAGFTPTDARIKFFEGTDGVTSLLKEMLWDAEDEILSFWPYHEMFKVLSADDLELFNRRRIKQNIALKVIWSGSNIPKKHFWSGADYKVERRIAPRNYTAPMGYSVYGDKVSFISSAKEQYGFIVHSLEFSALMRMQFSALWSSSK
jgi:sugar-specific transcriptional regulator TrmB